MAPFYVIIVTYNGEKWINRCLSSVFNSTIKAIPIVVDNGSKDNTLNIIKEKFPQTIIMESGGNVGFGQANNKAIQYAIEKGAEYVYLLNQDAWVDNNVFEVLLSLMNKYPDYGIISPIQITANRTKIDKNFLHNDISDERCPNLKSDLLLGNLKDIYELYVAMAAHWMLRLSCVKRIGLFSDAFPHYGEDSNLMMRMHYHKIKIGLSPHVFGVHDREDRVNSAQKYAYLYYIQSLIGLHDIFNDSTKLRARIVLRSIIKILIIKEVSFKQKLDYLLMIVRCIYPARHYRKKYKETNE